MGLINWIFDFYQQSRIETLTRESAIRGSSGGVDVKRLELALGELALANRTMQRMLVEKGVCTQEELHAKLKQVDLEDGREDGRAPLV